MRVGFRGLGQVFRVKGLGREQLYVAFDPGDGRHEHLRRLFVAEGAAFLVLRLLSEEKGLDFTWIPGPLDVLQG